MGFILTALVPKQEGGKQRIIGLEWISKHLPIYLLTLWLLSVLKTGLEIYVISPFYIVFENLHPFSIWHFVIGIFWYFGLLSSKKKKKEEQIAHPKHCSVPPGVKTVLHSKLLQSGLRDVPTPSALVCSTGPAACWAAALFHGDTFHVYCSWLEKHSDFLNWHLRLNKFPVGFIKANFKIDCLLAFVIYFFYEPEWEEH